MGDVWFTSDDPSLPTPWKGVVDGTTGCLYYWNPETNITQYEKPAYLVSSLSPSPSCFPDPFYPPPSTASAYNLHSQYPNLYPHYQAPAETVINGYTFPTQFPFPNHTHTPTNQPINPQSSSTDYHYHLLTHPSISHPLYHLPPFATSAYPSESDYGYLSSLPYPSDQSFSCDPYSTSPHNSSYSQITYPHTEPKQSIIPLYQLPYGADLIPPSALAHNAGGTSCTEKNDVPPPEMKKSLRHNLKMRSHVMMKRKPRSQFPRRRRTQNNGDSEGDSCRAPLLMAVNWDSTVLFTKSIDSVSELTNLDLAVKNGSSSVSSKDAPLFFPGDKKKPFLSVEGVYGQMLGPDEFCNSERAKDLLRLAYFQRIKDNSGGPLVDWELRSIDMELARFYFNLSLEKTITNSGHILTEDEQNAIVIHFCNLVVVNHFSLVTNFFSGLNSILLSMSFVELPMILEVSIPESYEHVSKNEAGEFDKFMAWSFTVELIKILRVAHLQATLYDWKVREKNVVSGSAGGFEYDVHLENLTRNFQQLCVNIKNGKGIESNCSVMYHWLPSLNWNQASLLDKEINFQEDFSYLGKGIVRLHNNLYFSAEIHFLGLITSIVHLGLETIMHTSSHAWDLQFHKLQTCWITAINAFIATLSLGLNKGSFVVVLSICSGTIHLPSPVTLNSHSEVMVTSCHLFGGKYSDHVWLYFLTNKDQGVKVILISMENLVQCLSFMFDLNSQNVIVIFIINQPLLVRQLFSLRFDTAVICLLILFAKLILIICGMTHKNLDGAALPNALWSAPICKDIIQLQLHSTVIIAFLLGTVSTRTRSDTHIFHYSGSHSSLASINMKLQVYPILYDLGLQKHGHELNYFFMACVVLALFLLVATMLIKDVNGGHLYLIIVVVIHEVLFCQLGRFFVKVIDYLQGNSEFFPMSYSSSPIVLLPTIDIQSLMHIMFQDGLLMTHEHGRALLFANTSTVFESLSVNSITKLVTLKYKKETLDVNFPAAIFYIAFLFFSLLQLIQKFRPNQLVEPPRCCMSKQEILATFWLYLPTALSSLGDWVFILPSLIVIWVHVLISNTILPRELKFDHESHITPTGTMATGLVFPFGENSRGAFFQYGCSTNKDTKIMLSECLTFYGGTLSLNTTVMICICVDQLTLKSTTQTLWLAATAQMPFIVNPKDVVVQSGILILSTFKFIFTLVMGNKIVGVDGMIEEVQGKVTIHDVIPFILLTDGSCGCWNAKNPKARDCHAQMWGEGIQSTVSLPTEDPSTVAGQTNTTGLQLKDNWFNYPPTTISRHEDMPSFKGGGMIGSLGYGHTLVN